MSIYHCRLFHVYVLFLINISSKPALGIRIITCNDYEVCANESKTLSNANIECNGFKSCFDTKMFFTNCTLQSACWGDSSCYQSVMKYQGQAADNYTPQIQC